MEEKAQTIISENGITNPVKTTVETPTKPKRQKDFSMVFLGLGILIGQIGNYSTSMKFLACVMKDLPIFMDFLPSLAPSSNASSIMSSSVTASGAASSWSSSMNISMFFRTLCEVLIIQPFTPPFRRKASYLRLLLMRESFIPRLHRLIHATKALAPLTVS